MIALAFFSELAGAWGSVAVDSTHKSCKKKPREIECFLKPFGDCRWLCPVVELLYFAFIIRVLRTFIASLNHGNIFRDSNESDFLVEMIYRVCSTEVRDHFAIPFTYCSALLLSMPTQIHRLTSFSGLNCACAIQIRVIHSAILLGLFCGFRRFPVLGSISGPWDSPIVGLVCAIRLPASLYLILWNLTSTF